MGAPAVSNARLQLPAERLEQFCLRWGIAELALFGSVLRDDFRDESDVDVLVSFRPGVRHGLIGAIEMEEELSRMVGRRVDLLTRKGVEIAAASLGAADTILKTAEVVYGG